MALGAATHGSAHSGGAAPNAPVRFDLLTFAGDGAYGAGGTAAFEAYVQAALGQSVTVLAVLDADTTGYVKRYDITNDKLMVFYCTNNAGAQGPLIEDTTANQSGRTYSVIVISV